LITRQTARLSYLGLIFLQPLWHAVLPPPAGAGNWLLAAAATLPLLLVVRGVWRGSLRSMTWAGYLATLFLTVGVMEAWANPPQRLAALLQVALVLAFLVSVLAVSRSGRPAR